MKYIASLLLFLAIGIPTKASEVVIAWSADVTPQVGYNIYRSPHGAPLVKLSSTSALTYTDLTVTPGSTYDYGLTAYYLTCIPNVPCESIMSNVVTVSIPAVTPPPTFTPIRIKAGGSAYTDSQHNIWSPDTTNCTGGTVTTFSHAITKALPSATDQTLYQSERFSNSTCTFSGIPAGTYSLTIKEAEDFWTVGGKRVFSVSINGVTVWPSVDLFTLAGGEYVALDKTFPVTLTAAGNIVVKFIDGPVTATDVNAKYDAIQLVQSALPPPPTQSMSTVCSFTSPTVWTCNSTLQNIPAGQTIQAVTTTGTLSNTTNGTVGTAIPKAVPKRIPIPKKVTQ